MRGQRAPVVQGSGVREIGGRALQSAKLQAATKVNLYVAASFIEDAGLVVMWGRPPRSRLDNGSVGSPSETLDPSLIIVGR